MVSIFVFIMPAFFALLLLIVTVAVYFFIYKRNINKALNDRDSVKRRMPPPYKVLIGAASVIIILTILFISVVRVNSGNNGGGLEDKYFAASYSFNVYQPDEMTGYLSAYSIEEYVGYKKYVEDIGDVRVTYFMSEENYDVYHPGFIAYVEYVGTKDVLNYGYWGNFLTPDGTNICGRGAAGSDVEDYFVVVGSTSIECTFQLDMYYYDSEAKGEEIEDGAASSQTIKLILDPTNEE